MTEQILSPGIYSQETDQSAITTGVTQTGLAVVGPTEKGPAYVPQDVTSYAEFVAKFGADSSETYVPQTVASYLQAGNTVKVTRVLGNGGWLYDDAKQLVAIVDDSNSKIITVLHPSKNDEANLASLNDVAASGTYEDFELTIDGDQLTAVTVSASLEPTSDKYLLKVIGKDENYQEGSGFPYLHFSNYYTGSVTPDDEVTLLLTDTAVTFTSSYAEGYDAAKTPWILSDGNIRLFRFVHRGHGFKTNRDVKISIANITKNSDSSIYSTFDILVRKWNDTDRTPSIIEQYTGVTLNPDSPNYLGKVIGDKYTEYDETLGRLLEHGEFLNKSNYVRVEITDGVKAGSVAANIIPAGFEAVYEPIAGFTDYFLPSASLTYSSTSSTSFSGFDYSNLDNANYLNPLPTEAGTGSNVAFTKTANENKFTIPMQGGTDGTNYATKKKIGSDIESDGTNVFGFDLSTSTTAGTAAYEKAIDILANPEEFSFDLLVLPGVIHQYHSAVTSLAESMAEERADCVYIMDLTGMNESVITAVDEASSIDSSYSATYFPWVKVRDIGSNKDIYVPPSVIVPQAYAYNDRVGEEWFAPAGINRGALGGAMDTRYRLYKSDRDNLYKGRVNPITKFTTTGVVIYGQKTLQVAETAINRINVRRLLIALRRFISDNVKGFVFEQNTNATRIKLKNILNPYMESVKQKQGLYAYQVIVDDTNNTSDVIDRNELQVMIKVAPTRTIEFVLLTFVISPSGVTL